MYSYSILYMMSLSWSKCDVHGHLEVTYMFKMWRTWSPGCDVHLQNVTYMVSSRWRTCSKCDVHGHLDVMYIFKMLIARYMVLLNIILYYSLLLWTWWNCNTIVDFPVSFFFKFSSDKDIFHRNRNGCHIFTVNKVRIHETQVWRQQNVTFYFNSSLFLRNVLLLLLGIRL